SFSLPDPNATGAAPTEIGAALRLVVDRIAPTALQPWLESSGIAVEEPQQLRGKLRATLTQSPGRIHADLDIEEVRLIDASIAESDDASAALPSVSLGRFGLDGVTIDSDHAAITIDRVEIAAPTVAAARDADGTFHFAGVAFAPPASPTKSDDDLPAATEPAGPPSVEASDDAGTTGSPWTVHVDEVRWHDTRVVFDDVSPSGPQRIELADLRLEIDDLAHPIPADRPIAMRFDTRIPGLWESGRVEGTVRSNEDRWVAELQGTMSAIESALLVPYIGESEWSLSNGYARGTLRAEVSVGTGAAEIRLDALELGRAERAALTDGELTVRRTPRATVPPDSANPERFELELGFTLPERLDRLAVGARVALDPPRDAAAELSFAADGIHGASLDEWLPSELRCLLDPGRLGFTVSAHVAPSELGGHAVRASIDDFELAGSDPSVPAVRFEKCGVDAPRIDPTASVFEIARVALTGVTGSIRTRDDGSTEVAGFRRIAAAPSDEPRAPDSPTSDPASPTPADTPRRNSTPPTIRLSEACSMLMPPRSSP
ncbi:MAG: DUF748 domain-containing protein, partial [Planctomycetes bacterium]|nr:DUF748 domain-containing protein [Planctomycetota bacterium]